MCNSLNNIITRLTEMAAADFNHEQVLECFKENRLSLESLEPYLYFSSETYTRNVIHRTATFELLAIGWESGQESPIHNHHNQRCWTRAIYGKLFVQNFRVTRRDALGNCELASGPALLMDSSTPLRKDFDVDAHRVSNLAPFNSRAVSLHIYSKPFDNCEVYDRAQKNYRNISFSNTSEFGTLNPGAQARKLTCSQVRDRI